MKTFISASIEKSGFEIYPPGFVVAEFDITVKTNEGTEEYFVAFTDHKWSDCTRGVDDRTFLVRQVDGSHKNIEEKQIFFDLYVYPSIKDVLEFRKEMEEDNYEEME